MKTFKEYLSETETISQDKDRWIVKDSSGKEIGSYSSREAAERHRISKQKGVRK